MSLTIIMYHYVRDLRRSRYPEIKGLDISLFKRQLTRIRSSYKIVSMREVIEDRQGLPDNAALLTFDDGYVDHYLNVFPLLDEIRVQGAFFPVAGSVREGKVLDVNKIHFILASVKDKSVIVRDILSGLDKFRSEYHLETEAYYREKWARPSRWDDAEVTFIKRLLQVGLPLKVRAAIADELFMKYVSVDEAAFAAELYMSADQIKCMIRNGQFVGSHGYNHVWLGALEPANQADDIDRSLDFLRSLGAETKNWVMCYPYGDYNSSLLEILRTRGCAVALTTHSGVATVKDGALLLPRLDTNEV